MAVGLPNLCKVTKRRVWMLLLLFFVPAFLLLSEQLRHLDLTSLMTSITNQDATLNLSAAQAPFKPPKPSSFNRSFTTSKPVAEPQNKTGCHVPNYNPFDPVALKFTKELPPVQCERSGPWLSRVEGGTVIVNETLLSIRKEKLVDCSYKRIQRVSDGKISYSEPTVFQTNISIQPGTEAIKVTCHVEDWKSQKREYVHLHYVMVEKPDVEEQLQPRMRARQERSTSTKEEKRTGKSIPSWMNIMIVGVDSVSRFSMIRTMKRTRKFLLDTLHAIDFINYDKVGKNTFPNMFSMMTGRTPPEAKWTNKKFIDRQGFRFLWQDFADEGYRTLLIEDVPVISMFKFAQKGFLDQPFHYYARALEMAKHQHSKIFTKGGVCLGGIPNYELTLRHLTDFSRLFRGKPHFGFLWMTKSTHDDPNGGSKVDRYYKEFLVNLHAEDLLNNTLLLFVSDHGYRTGGFRNTPMGKFEWMRPFLYLVFPRWFAKAYPALMERVQMNAARQTTPLDMYSTLLDILFLNNEDTYKNQRPKTSHGVSFFQQIPDNRTCVDAGIPIPYCVCLSSRPLSTQSALALQAGTALLAALNAAMANVTDVCHTLTLSNVTKFAVLESQGSSFDDICKSGKKKNTNEPTLYVATVIAKQNDAMFEGVLSKCHNSTGFNLEGEVSRLNLYGNTSHCAQTPYLKTICYCKDQRVRS